MSRLMAHHGMEVMDASPAAEFARFATVERERWAGLIRSKKISTE